MAKIQRKTQKVFAGSASNNGQFGSAQAGTKVTSADLDVLQQLAAFDSGWVSAVLSGERLPTLEEMQALHYITTSQIAYTLQEGVAEYDSGTEYHQNSIVKKSGTYELYGSLTNTNTGNTLPSQTDNTNWKYLGSLDVLKDAAPLVLASGSYPRGTGTGIEERTTAQTKSDLGITTLESDVTTLESDVSTLEGQVVTGFIHVVDQKGSTSDGGSNATGTATRTLNTVKTNTIPGASLSSNRVTLPAGTYLIDASCQNYRTQRSRAILYNFTTSSEISLGQSFDTATSGAPAVQCTVKHIATFGTTTQLELRNYTSASNSGDGLGIRVNDGRSNIYAEMLITKIG